MKPTKQQLLEALTDIAAYPLPVYTFEVEGETRRWVPIDNAEFLRQMAKDALGLE